MDKFDESQEDEIAPLDQPTASRPPPSLHKSLFKSLPPKAPSGGPIRNNRRTTPQDNASRSVDLNQSWNDYFDEKIILEKDDNFKFNVYRKGDSSLPAFFMIHGGGFTGLTWANFTSEIVKLSKVQCIAPDLLGLFFERVQFEFHVFIFLV